jgi:diguanylate cyclase (GGDEF)-like protein
VARRLLGLFCLCALLPVAGLATVAFHHVSEQLREQSRQRMHWTARAMGSALHERLALLETELRGVAAQRAAKKRSPDSLEHLAGDFRSLTWLPGRGAQPEALLGPAATPPALDAPQQAHLDSGRGVLVRGAEPDTWMLLLRAPRSAALLLGAFDASTFLDAAFVHAEGDVPQVCVFDEGMETLGCSGASVPVAVRLQAGASRAGDLEWSGAQGDSYWGYHRTLFLRGPFAHADWHVVVQQPRAAAFASLADFKQAFAAVIALSLGIVLLLSTRQIRRSLGPLRALQRGTARVAGGDFSEPVEVRSRDEFEDLAVAFNGMAQQLERQLRGLDTRNELDRAILSALRPEDTVEQVLKKLPSAYPCSSVSVAVVDPEQPLRARQHLAVPGEKQPLHVQDVMLSNRDRELVAGDAHGVHLVVDDTLPSFLAAHAYTATRSLLVLPLQMEGELIAVLALGRSDADPASREEQHEARQLADQVAVALANARMHEEVSFLAYHDSLTRLPNRLWVRDTLEREIKKADEDGAMLGLLFLDLDRFKRVNDTLGHTVGDRLLAAAADRLRATVEALRAPGSPIEGLTVELARLGGDEFMLLVSGAQQLEQVELAAERVRDCLIQPFYLGGHELAATTSIGVAVYPSDGSTVASLFKNADAALHDAKDRGRNRIRYYVRAMSQGTLVRITLESRLRRALENDGFALAYQPILDVRTGRLAGAEALLRLSDPDLAVVGPAEFIPVAEETGLIVAMGEWVLREACGAVRRWVDAGHQDIRVAVNLSPRQFRGEKFVDTITSILAETGARARNLAVEITESTLMEAREESAAALRRLRALGLKVSVDDFGTGYSSLAYLKHFPVDTLKIDRSFVRDVARNADDAAIARAIIALGRSLSLSIVAEGVEDQEQLNLLRKEGCDFVQGYMIGTPLPEAAFAAKFLDGRLV